MPQKKDTISNLKTSIPAIFQECQKSAANHRKHAIGLRKIQEHCASTTSSRDRLQTINIAGETAFNEEVVRNLNKILPIKKREPNTDRIIKFVATFMHYTQEKDAKGRDEDGDEEMDSDQETVSSRFVEFLMRHLLKGTNAKDKPVRLRCCQLIALSINSLGELDEDLYQQLKKALFERVRDKEAAVRVQAVIALSRLQGTDDEEDQADGKTVTQKLMDILENDPSAEVRRVVLFNIEQAKETLPYILNRARDVDAINRRSVYLKPMAEIPDFRLLSIDQREQLLRAGLTDRDPMVKKACSKMLATNWIQHAGNNLLEFLERLDVMESKAAEDALMSFFSSRPDIIKSLKFDDYFWENITVEGAFLVRIFDKYCKANEIDENPNATMPEVTRHAFYIQRYNNLMQEARLDDTKAEEYEFIVGQLLEMAKTLDYADEIGRRKMFSLLREMLMVPEIPDDHLESIVDIMKSISLNERDFTRVIIEVISDIRELIENDDGDEAVVTKTALSTSQLFKNADEDTNLDILTSPAKKARLISEPSEDDDKAELEKMYIQLKCLNICRYMLERSEETLRENPSLYGLLNELIIPAVQSFELLVREQGLHCLGLCCILDQALASQNMPLFIHCVNNGHDELQKKALMIIFDLYLAYGYNNITSRLDDPQQLIKALGLALASEDAEVQRITVEGIAKLMLPRMLRDEEILGKLVLLYFDPRTVNNLRLRQCLSYFFPVYCHSSTENQVSMQKIFIPTFRKLLQMYKDLTKNQEMVAPLQIGQMMIDWTDPRKVFGAAAKTETGDESIHNGLHGDIAIEILKALFTESISNRKILCQLLNRLYIDESGEMRIRKMTLLIGNLKNRKPFADAITRNTFNRFETMVSKYFGDAPESLNDEDLAQAEEYKAIVEFVDSIEDEYIEPIAPTPSRSKRSRATKAKALSKLEREMEELLSSEEEEQDDEDEEEEEYEEDKVDEEVDD